MLQQILHENWKMKKVGAAQWRPAVVPGTVYTDMLRNGDMEDPFWKDNEDQACALMEEDYEYEASFHCDDSILNCSQVKLHFDGVDTIADIYLNGCKIGETCNMHRVWEFEVKSLLNSGENTLRVYLHSPLQYIREKFKECRTIGNDDTYEGFVHMRKAHCMFGWDWGAHLPDAGIFRPVKLIGIQSARIDSVYVKQCHEAGCVTLQLDVRAETPAIDIITEEEVVITKKIKPSDRKLQYQVEITDPTGCKTIYTGSPEKIRIENPMLWWPNGYGEQYLYTICVRLQENDTELDLWERRIGLRTMTMRIEKDEWGECFAHEVNGITVFAMGADYIPEDHLLGRVTPETTRKLLLECKAANFNTVRVWGGGYYPEDWFFDLCDELGLMVWQDFMFACAVYELTPEFEANIRQEFIDNIKRIRHHASLGLWCGNNEMEMFVDERNWVTKHTEVRDYLFMYERLIPEVLREYDPQTFYWPASPSSGGSFDEPNDPNRGDVHYWKVWHGNRPFSEYRKFYFRYASEFGFQALPAFETIKTFTDDPKDWNMFSYIMEKHERQYGACGKIMGYMQQIYLYPSDFRTLIYASQLLQADAIRYGVEHFRRNRNNNRCMGAIYWQLNDCWPVISWSSIDYCGRLKALHYYARRFFAPLMISCQEEGWMTQEANMNREHFEFEKSIRLNVANETREDAEVEVVWAVRNAAAKVLREEKTVLTVPALTSSWLDKVELPDIDVFTEYVSYELYKNGEMISDGTVIFSYPKYFRYENPELSVTVDGDELVISANAYAKSVEILNETEDLKLSDNYFDMNAGTKRVRVLEGEVKGLKVRSVYDIR
ncbi:MAG: glycoside hydrolase family 2 protein [Lachnospiraceae bacterium]|nr:glycoside hydrolase family 2 protein [Lachnospiraceae bacterium]